MREEWSAARGGALRSMPASELISIRRSLCLRGQFLGFPWVPSCGKRCQRVRGTHRSACGAGCGSQEHGNPTQGSGAPSCVLQWLLHELPEQGWEVVASGPSRQGGVHAVPRAGAALSEGNQ